MNIATTEPSSLTAGDTATWLKSLPDYPATDGWALETRGYAQPGLPVPPALNRGHRAGHPAHHGDGSPRQLSLPMN